MKRSLYSPPEAFSRSPLLAILPVQGKVGRLESLTSSLYARYENVVLLQKEVGEAVEPKDMQRYGAEEKMLLTVLEWLAVEPDKAS